MSRLKIDIKKHYRMIFPFPRGHFSHPLCCTPHWRLWVRPLRLQGQSKCPNSLGKEDMFLWACHTWSVQVPLAFGSDWWPDDLSTSLISVLKYQAPGWSSSSLIPKAFPRDASRRAGQGNWRLVAPLQEVNTWEWRQVYLSTQLGNR